MAHGVCPFWVGYFLICPLRRLYQNPRKLLEPYVRRGMKVLDIGCAMGFFSLPLAEMVGDGGMVVCVDIQEKMIHKLEKRARKAGLSERIRTRIAGDKSLCLDDLKEQIDFALAFAVVHEFPDPEIFFSEIFKTLKPSGRFLIAEPGGRVTEEGFEMTVSTAEKVGFRRISRPQIRASRTELLEK
jgi:ubiquinone/menaquinone biosynthesis C-methylase UbiE